MHRTLWLVLACLSMAALLAKAGEPARPADENAKVFDAFSKLGFPNVATATYVKVQGCWTPRIEDPLPYDYESSGNAWMIAETRDPQGQPVKGTFVVNGGEVIEIGWSSARRSPRGGANPLAMPSSAVPKPEGQWRKTNPERDVKTALRFLKSIDRESSPEVKLDADMRGKLFLLAFALQQRGDAANSNLLLTELFRRVEPRQKVVIDAMNALADAQYENLYRRFRADHDWTAYRKGITDLLASYARGWRKAPAMRVLLSRVEARLSQPSPVPAVTNGMTEADLKLAGAMTSLRAIRTAPDTYSYLPILWLVPASWPGVTATDAELEVRGRGVKGIPYLLAMAADGALTEADRAAVGGGDTMGFRLSSVGGMDDEQAALEVFDTLNRPATRGEMAKRWLTDMVPERFTGGPYNQKKGEELVEAFQEFHHRHGKDSDEELAALCLPDRYGSLNAAATDFLLSQAKSKRVPALEAFLLPKQSEAKEDEEVESGSPGVPQEKVDLLVKYAALRGTEARPMVQAFAAQLRKAADDFEKPKNYSFSTPEQEQAFIEEHRQGLRKAAAGLEAIVYDVPVAERVGLVAEGAGTNTYERTAVLVQLGAMPLPEAIRLLLKQAVETDRPQARMALAGLVRSVVGKSTVVGVKPTEQADQWRKLIADDRATDPAKEALVSDQFLILNERLFATLQNAEDEKDARWQGDPAGAGRPAAQLMTAFGRPGREWLRARVEARLAGMPEDKLPNYPSDVPLDAKGCESLKKKLANAEGRTKAIEVVAGLSLYERAGLPELLRKEPELNARLVPSANLVTKVTVDGMDQALQAKWLAWQGKVFDRGFVDDLQSFCTTQATAGHPVTGLLTRGRDFGGCEVSIHQGESVVDEPQAKHGEKAKSRPVTGLKGVVCGHDLYQVVSWRTAPAPKEESWGNIKTSEPDAIRAFQKAMDEFCGSKLAMCDEAFVVFATKGDAE